MIRVPAPKWLSPQQASRQGERTCVCNARRRHTATNCAGLTSIRSSRRPRRGDSDRIMLSCRAAEPEPGRDAHGRRTGLRPPQEVLVRFDRTGTTVIDRGSPERRRAGTAARRGFTAVPARVGVGAFGQGADGRVIGLAVPRKTGRTAVKTVWRPRGRRCRVRSGSDFLSPTPMDDLRDPLDRALTAGEVGDDVSVSRVRVPVLVRLHRAGLQPDVAPGCGRWYVAWTSPQCS